MATSSAQQLPHPRSRSGMDIYVPGIVLRSIMSCGGPSFFLQRSKEPELSENGLMNFTRMAQQSLLAGSDPRAITWNQFHGVCSKDMLPDPQTVSEWLKNGCINREKLQNVRNGQLRKLISTRARALPLAVNSHQVLEAPMPEPFKESWPASPSKVANCQQQKLEDNEEENLLKEALKGLIIGLSSAVLFCSILFRFVLKNKV